MATEPELNCGMDSGSQCSVVGENESMSERVPQAEDNSAVGMSSEKSRFDNGIATTPAAGKGNETPPHSTGVPVNADSPAGMTPPTRKGYGLRKWRRVRRHIQRDTSPVSDSNKVLKRVLPALVNPSKPFNNNEASAGSTSGLGFDGVADGSGALGSSVNSKFVGAPAFAAGADSDNSEDRSSRSSTAASFPKFRSELPSGSGLGSEKNRIKNVGGNILSGSVKSSQQGKGRVESSKKQRGDRIKIKKENSRSSMESDSRSSNFIFMQANSVTSNGKNINYDVESSDDADESRPQFSEEAQAGHSKLNSGDFDDRSQDDSTAEVTWKARKEKHENHHSTVDTDPLVDSILSLQSLQESLERELQNFAEIGKGAASPPSANGSSPHRDRLDPELISQVPPSFLQLQILTLTENVKNLEDKLEEARATVQVKEARVSELEAALNNHSKSPNDETDSGEVDSKMEGLFRQKIEVEIEYLAIARAIGKLRVEEQQSLADVEMSMIYKLGQVESKAAELKKQAAEEAYSNLVSADIKGVDEVLTYQTRFCKASFFLILQLVLLLVMCWLVSTRLSSEPEVPVPT